MRDLPKIVVTRLQEAAELHPHPDANLLTAFAEHSLADFERVRVTEHLSRCGNCREIAALALSATEAVAVTTSIRARNNWFSWPVLRRGLVAAGILAATAVGVWQYRLRQVEVSEPVASTRTSRNDTATTAQAFQPSPRVFEPQASLPATDTRQAEVRKKALPNSLNAAPVGEPDATVNPIPPKPYASRGGSSAGGMRRGFAPAESRTTPRGADQPVAVPPSSQVAEMQRKVLMAPAATAENRIPLQTRALQNSDVVKAKPPAPAQVVSRDVAAPSPATAKVSSLQITPALKLRASQSWNISSAGVLQRSLDAGRTWEDVNLIPVSQADFSQAENGPEVGEKKVVRGKPTLNLGFRAVMAIGSEVWAGGSGAMLYHSSDSGFHWTRILPSAAGVVLTGEITRVEFSDPQHGRITSSAGEVWTTDDGGQSWSLAK